MKKNKIVSDSLALTIVKLMTALLSIVSTIILSRSLSLENYGTYSTGNLLVNTFTLFSAFGLVDAVNFYYNGKEGVDRDKYVNTVIGLIMSGGLLAAIVMLVLKNYIADYFHNTEVIGIIIYIAFRPVLSNVGLGYQYLQVSIGKAKIVAIRNSIISISKLVAIVITALYTKDIKTIFACMLIVELLSVVFYSKILSDNGVKIKPWKIEKNLIKEILIYCIPMGLYIQTTSLSRDLDKYVIGYFENTDRLAVYTNCSTRLPFDLISGPLFIVIIPLLTRCIRNNDLKKGGILFKANLKIGLIFSLTFGAAVILLAKESILFLYGEKYLSGYAIFILYVLVDVLNFISFSLVLAAKGKTKQLMLVSVAALMVNCILNIVFYFCFGFIGPAISTVLVTMLTNITLLYLSGKILDMKLWQMFDFKHIVKMLIEILIFSVVVFFINLQMTNLEISYVIRLIGCGFIFVMCMFLVNFKEVKSVLASVSDDNLKENKAI